MWAKMAFTYQRKLNELLPMYQLIPIRLIRNTLTPFSGCYTSFRVVFCKRCSSGVINSGLKAPLKRFHADLLMSRRQAVLQYLNEGISLTLREDLPSLLPQYLNASNPCSHT